MRAALKQSATRWLRPVLATMRLVAGGGGADAQIPVTDLVSITQSVTQQAETIAKWIAQAKQLDAQISQARQQYEAMTGARGLGSILNNSALNSALPSDWTAVASSVKSTPAYAGERAKYPTLPSSPKANALYDAIASQNVSTSDFYTKASERVILKGIPVTPKLRSVIDLARVDEERVVKRAPRQARRCRRPLPPPLRHGRRGRHRDTSGCSPGAAWPAR